MTAPSDPGPRPGSKRKREPVTLDLKATEVETGGRDDASSLVDDPRTPADPPEAAVAAQESMPDDPRAPDHGPDRGPEPTPNEIEAAIERLIPEAGGATAGADVPLTQDTDEASPPEPAPGPDSALAAAPAMPAGGASDRIDGRSPPEEEPAAPAAPPEPRRSGIGGLLAAAILGGLLGAALTAAAERYWPKGADATGARIAQLEQRLAAAPTADVGALERRLSGLEARQQETAQRAEAAQAAAERASQRAEQGSRPADPGAAPQPVAGGPDPAVLERIDARIAALEEQTHGQAEAASQGARELQDRVADQAKQVAALAPQLAEQERRLAAVAAQSSEQAQRVAALSQQVGQQGQQLEGLAKKFAERGPEATAALRVVAADRVVNAVRDGAPFPEAFGALARLGTDPQRLSAIEPFAKAGAPTAGALSQEFRPASQRILAEARGPATSWGERLGRMAEGIVTIRPVGEPGSNDVPSLVARIDGALARGAFAEAAAAWDALPEPARQNAAEFGRRLKARAAADDAARTISNQALAALDAATR
ncbi:MAG TPA: hypothetical protein VF601_05575 [Beijerinckiaceae bacterium]